MGMPTGGVKDSLMYLKIFQGHLAGSVSGGFRVLSLSPELGVEISKK